jgi:uncharacterized protein YlxW (UPF0749 family)
MIRPQRSSISVTWTCLVLLSCLNASAQESPPVPDAGTPASATKGTREEQLEDEVRQLKEMVRQLSNRVEDLSARTAAKEQGGGEKPAPEPSGLAGPGGFKRDRSPGDSGLREPR